MLILIRQWVHIYILLSERLVSDYRDGVSIGTTLCVGWDRNKLFPHAEVAYSHCTTTRLRGPYRLGSMEIRLDRSDRRFALWYGWKV
jgi:hypothetical protein